jgi:hypothetical protein
LSAFFTDSGLQSLAQACLDALDSRKSLKQKDGATIGTLLAYILLSFIGPEEQKKRRRAKDGQASSWVGCPPGN